MWLLISSVCAGLSLYAVAWVMGRPWALRPFGAGAHGRHILLHLAWPWIMAIKPWCEPMMSWRMRASLTRHLRRAGAASVWEAGHVLALQCLAFLVVLGPALLLPGVLWTLTWAQQALWALGFALLAALLPRWHLRALAAQRQQGMLRALPFLLDMTTLCVEAGLNLQGALQQAACHGPAGPLRDELQHALDDIRAGMPRLQALARFAERTDLAAVASLVAALAHAEQTGSSLAPLLRAQSDQRRTERFLRAEALALKAPVKMLFPLVTCIFPCTFLIIGFPIVVGILADLPT